MGAPLNAPSTSVRLARPLRAWVILKIAPPKLPDWVFTFGLGFLPLAAASRAPPVPPGRAVVIFSVPWSASITAPDGICVAPVSWTNCPAAFLMNTVPLTGWAFSDSAQDRRGWRRAPRGW